MARAPYSLKSKGYATTLGLPGVLNKVPKTPEVVRSGHMSDRLLGLTSFAPIVFVAVGVFIRVSNLAVAHTGGELATPRCSRKVEIVGSRGDFGQFQALASWPIHVAQSVRK